MSRSRRFIQPDDHGYCDKATGQFTREYPKKFLEGAARNNKAPFRQLANPIENAKQEVLDQWSYVTLIEERCREARVHALRVLERLAKHSDDHTTYADMQRIYDLIPI